MRKVDKLLFIVFALCISFSQQCNAAEPEPLEAPRIIQPDPISDVDDGRPRKQIEIAQGFENQFPRFEYFLQEITNIVDTDPSIYFYNYINPTVSDQAFINSSFNIYEKILLLKNIEKSSKERAAMHAIDNFLDSNYKTQILPSYAYINNPQLPAPIYMSQLTDASLKAIKDGNMDLFRTLVNNYDVLSSKDNSGNGLLSTTIIAKRNNMVKLLISKGADVNSANSCGLTPIMLAAKTGNYEAADLLVKQNCNLTAVDLKGMSALDYAQDNKNTEIYFLLQNKLKTKSKMRRR